MGADDASKIDWREDGVKIIRSDQLDPNTPQTKGMTRAAAITHARTGASKLWAGTVTIHADAKTGAHHHGELKPLSMWSVDSRACGGATTLSMWPMPGRVILFTCHPLCRTRRSMPAATNS